MSINILLVEDNLAQARLVIALLEREPDLIVAGHAINGQAAEIDMDAIKPDVMILDLGLPDILALDLIPILKRISPTTRIVVYSARDQFAYQEAALNQGAACFISKSEPIAPLIDSVLVTVGQS